MTQLSTGSPVRRSVAVTVLAWIIILAGALLLPVTLITMAMILVGSPGTQTVELKGFLTVVVGPPLTLVAGIGLWRRWRWARYAVILLLAIWIAMNVASLASGGKTTTIHTTAAGETTTTENVWSRPNYHSLPLIIIFSGAVGLLLWPPVAAEFRQGRHECGKAANRHGPGYSTPAHASIPAAPPLSDHAGSPWVVIIGILVLIGLAVFMGWMVMAGLESGLLRDVLSRPRSRELISRDNSPVMFWFLIGLYSVFGMGSAGFAAMLLYVTIFPSRTKGPHTPLPPPPSV